MLSDLKEEPLKSLLEKAKTLKNNKTVKKYAFNTSWLFGEQIIRMVVSLFVGVWVARYLGPEKLGLLSYAQSLVGMFGAVATLGLNSIVIRDLIKKKDEYNNVLLGTAFTLKLMGAFVTLFFLWVAITATATDSYTQVIVFIIASSAIFQSLNVIDFFFQAKVQSKFVVYTNFTVLAISSSLKVLFIIIKAPLEYFAVIFLIESIILASGLVIFYKIQKNQISKWRFDRMVAIKLIKDSWPLIFSSISVSIGMRIDQIMLKEMMDERSVGYYAVGVKLAEIFNFIPVIISQSIYPKIVEMDFKIDRNKLIALIRYIFFPLVLIGVFVNTISFPIVDILYGAEFIQSVIVFDILIWTVPFVYLNLITIAILQTQNLNRIVLIRQTCLAIVNIVINLLLIPTLGIVGASLATVAAELSIIVFGFIITKERWIFNLTVQALLFIPKK